MVRLQVPYYIQIVGWNYIHSVYIPFSSHLVMVVKQVTNLSPKIVGFMIY